MLIRPPDQAIGGLQYSSGHWQPDKKPRGVTAHNYIALMQTYIALLQTYITLPQKRMA